MFQDLRRGLVAEIGKRHEITKRGHPVRAAGPGIGRSQRGQFTAFQMVHFFHLVIERGCHSGTGRRDMLERRGCRKARSFLQFLHKLPAVQGIQEIDVSRSAVQDHQWQIAAIFHIDGCGQLVRVAAVFQVELFHAISSLIKKRTGLGSLSPRRSADLGHAPCGYSHFRQSHDLISKL